MNRVGLLRISLSTFVALCALGAALFALAGPSALPEPLAPSATFTYPGAARIRSGGGTPLTVKDAAVVSNTSGASLAESGAGIFADGPITLVNVVLANNQALNGSGGGLRALRSANISGGRFERNVAKND